jgi:hypothetical protein
MPSPHAAGDATAPVLPERVSRHSGCRPGRDIDGDHRLDRTGCLPSAALRQANIHILGSGQGSVGAAEIVATLPRLVDELSRGSFPVDAVTLPLAEVESIWSAPRSGPTERIVLVPGA